jgi:hypothetical protein
MLTRLVLAELRNRPGRVLLLLVGYAFGVAVMVVLLSVGEAMLTQARDQSLVGGGDVLLVPTGISPEMIRAGGTTSMFLRISQARFVQRQVLESPRGREDFGIVAASPIVDGRAVEISAGGRTARSIASAEIPSRAVAAGASPRLVAGGWTDSGADSSWVAPDVTALLHEIDAFHLPYGSAVGDSTWAEWHYFNIVLDDERWLYLTYLIGGRVGIPGQWGGRLMLTVRDPAVGHRNLVRDIPEDGIRFDTLRADLTLDGDATVRVLDGAYELRAVVGGAELDLTVRPLANRFFPPAALGGPETVSGYAVPALAARASGTVCLPVASGGRRCEEVDDVRAYHDHNWGVWQDVAWDWGAASDEEVSLLYGAVRGPGVPEQGLFAYLVDGRGVRGLFRPSAVERSGSRLVVMAGDTVDVPTSLRFADPRRGLEVMIELTDHQVTDMERSVDRYFVQAAGVATVREAGEAPRRLRGFFEVYLQ